LLDRSALRKMSEEEASLKIRSLKGSGEFFSRGILSRGAGLGPKSNSLPKCGVQKIRIEVL
jgi:hypothetical protein